MVGRCPFVMIDAKLSRLSHSDRNTLHRFKTIQLEFVLTCPVLEDQFRIRCYFVGEAQGSVLKANVKNLNVQFFFQVTIN
jgi:hypothetical protein